MSGRGGVTTILVTFDQPLDPGTAAGPGRVRRVRGREVASPDRVHQRLAIKRVALQGGGSAPVAITLKKPAEALELTIDGTIRGRVGNGGKARRSISRNL